MIAENNSFLRQHFPQVLNTLNSNQLNKEDFTLQLIEAKSGAKTIHVLKDGRPHLIHSKYDPLKEAERFIDQFTSDVKNYEHVLFYGVGLGYQIEEFMRRYPGFSFSIYEPIPEVFQIYTNEKNINQLPTYRLKNIFVEKSQDEGKNFLKRLTQNMQERILLIVLPSYQQMFKEKHQQFIEAFKSAVSTKRTANYIDNLYSARWTLNSLLNFSKNIQTPNILDEEFKVRFKDKPVIIVSAGPSLEDDYEQLRYIKENNLAYIFAVGSANRALVAQNILPDAVCTYDPQEHNYNVFTSIIEKGINTIPMIYGTSVGFETLNWYQGPKFHMVTSQDTVVPYYLKTTDGKSIEIVYDSPTIAAVTFQLAAKLGCNPIIFAGQNLAFKNNQFYTKDVGYNNEERKVDVMEKDRQNSLFVENVFGELIETNPSFNNMRENIEFYIKQFPDIEVINATKGGAAIHGTDFEPIEKLIEQKLTKAVADENWYIGIENKYDTKHTLERINKMELSIDSFRKLYWEIQSILKDMDKYIREKKENKIAKHTLKFDKLMKKLIVNDCYICYIQPVNRAQFQALSIRAANVRKQTNEIERAKLLIDAFVPYLERCKQTLEQIVGSIYKTHGKLNQKITNPPLKFYQSNCNVFHYIGNWEKQNYAAGKSVDYHVKQMVGKGHSTLSFKFTGTSLKIIGSKCKESSNYIQISIDGHLTEFSARSVAINISETPNINQILFEKNSLENKNHIVEISILDDNNFMFTGVNIDKDGRVYHIHEVTEIEQLEIGKRIRCHYKSTYNKVGHFSGLGKETKGFIPPESSAYPEGDFYFIMVDEIDSEKKLIADRNVQHGISWDSLSKEGFCSKGGKCINESKMVYSRLLYGGYYSYVYDDNEWDKYINNKNKEYQYKEGIDWNTDNNISTWVQEGNFCYINKMNLLVTIRGEHKYTSVVEGKLKGSSFYHFSDSGNIASHLGFRPLIIIQTGK